MSAGQPRRRLLRATLAAALLAPAWRATAQVALSEADQRLKGLLERARAQAGSPALSDAERQALLDDGEAALAAGDTERAARHFEQAGFIRHAADAELGLIRTYMQQGEYRRALSFAAHTAGAHPDVGAGGAMYAWLLQRGGQGDIARVLLARQRLRVPGDAALATVESLLKSPSAMPTDALLAPPGRLAPFSPASADLPRNARVLGAGARVGEVVLTAISVLGRRERMFLRDGLGRVTSAELAARHETSGFAVLQLPAGHPLSARFDMAARDPFAGSPAYLIDVPSSAASVPAWPALHVGFLGAPLRPGLYALGIDAPASPRGGPILNAAGQWVGLAALHDGQDRAVLVSAVLAQTDLVSASPVAASAPALAIDEVYERAMAATVQVIGI